MTPSTAAPAAASLVIQPGEAFELADYEVSVSSYKGYLAAQVWYFDVTFRPLAEEAAAPQHGLLRVGTTDGSSRLEQELAIREALANYQMIAPTVVQTQQAAVVLTAPATKTPPGTTALATSLDSSESALEESENAEKEQKLPTDYAAAAADLSGEKLPLAAKEREPVTEDSYLSVLLNDEELDDFLNEDEQDAVEEADAINSEISAVDSVNTMNSDRQAGDERPAEVDDSNTETVETDSSTEPTETIEAKVENKGSDEQSSTDVEPSVDEMDNDTKDGDYLEEEYFEEKDTAAETSELKLIVLSAYPEESKTLATWLQETHTYEENLSVLIQVCQFFRYLHQRDWCFVHLLPEFIQLSQPAQFYDLTGAYAVGDTLTSGLEDVYCAPELSYTQTTVQDTLSSYIIGALLHQLMYDKPLDKTGATKIARLPVPRIYQILKICLSLTPEERFPINQLLDVLLNARQALRAGTITWESAHRSTVGLSLSRLQNEDSYGVRQQQLSNSEAVVMGILADGMGGMAEGDVASKLAVKTFLEEPIPAELKGEKATQWLETLVQKANDNITAAVRDGGTTLSVVMAVNRQLAIAHVGDSRIYLLRNGQLCQISEDHSLVAMLVASGEITPQESLEHPERNVLTKSLGSKGRLANGYIQKMTRWGEDSLLTLEDGDLLLLCSDGVWDLATDTELHEAFLPPNSIQAGVNHIIERVLDRGASDNATLLALKFYHDTERPD